MIESVLTGAMRGATSITFAGIGEVIAERSGVIYLGTEGSMLAGALAAVAIGIETGSPTLGAIAGVAAGMALAAVYGIVVLVRHANQVATGLAVTFLGLGLTSLFGQRYVSQGVVAFEPVAIPLLSEIDFVGDILFNHDPLTYLSVVAAPCAWWFLFRSGRGLVLRAAGERPVVTAGVGISVTRQRWLGLMIAGGSAGLGGAQLATAFARTWSENMVAGRGFIAVALVIFAGWNPLLIVAGALLFSGAVAFELELQARGVDVSIFLLDAIPYVLVIVVLAALSRRRQFAAPESLTKVFDAEVTVSSPSKPPATPPTLTAQSQPT
jgi:general nucleoside transport system permease protein